MATFDFSPQYDRMDCGAACLKMVAKHYGRMHSLQSLREKSGVGREGVSLWGLSEAAEKIGFRTIRARSTFNQLVEEVKLPCIAHWQQEHFIVVYKITPPSSRLFSKRDGKVYVADPAKGLLVYSLNEFMMGWASYQSQGEPEGIVLLLEPTPSFYEQQEETTSKEYLSGLSRLWGYLFSYKQMLLQLGIGLLISCLLQLIFPFLTKSIVDVGISTGNLNFVYLVLGAQLMLFAGRTSVDFIRSWITLHISTRINIHLLTDFLAKLMRLPFSFFDTKLFGDILQRIQDQHRIEEFLTSTIVNTLFSLFNIIIFGLALALLNLSIFSIFLVGTLLYLGWIALFLRQRRVLDEKRFEVEAKNQSKIVQLIEGIGEIKLANSEMQKRWDWEHTQARLFRLSKKVLALNQYQQAGGFFFNESKNILITFMAAKAVIRGELTLGTMLAVQYIIGQLNSPIEQLVRAIQSTQDAKMSLSRLNEIHQLADEQPSAMAQVNFIPFDKDISIKNVSFSYPGEHNTLILKNISMQFPAGKTTAIVGTSGSGKTTLLKLLLKFYPVTQGDITVGDVQLATIGHQVWRSACGSVMQDGYIFSDSISQNIAVGEPHPDMPKLMHAVKVANIDSFIKKLPLGYNTKIGMEGVALSQGQKQRILIARAVYKNPSFLFFDEATNALDANNEAIIVSNLEQFFVGRTVIVVAHRLSTVRNADQIIVLKNGEVVEQGSHDYLIELAGDYYQLVKNQLELGH